MSANKGKVAPNDAIAICGQESKRAKLTSPIKWN